LGVAFLRLRYHRAVVRGAVFALSLCAAALAAGCVTPSSVEIDLTARFDTPARAASAVRLEVELLRGGCGGASVLDTGPLTVVRGEAAMSASVSVLPGTYCARGRAYDRSCVEFARGETTFTADRGMALALELRPADARRTCAPSACSAGRCRSAAMDAGADAPLDVPPIPLDIDLLLPDFPSGPADAPRPVLTDAGPVNEPRAVAEGCSLAAALQLSAGASHTCAVVPARGTYCWGRDDEGRLGAGEVRFESRVPVAVAGGLTFERVSAGGAHTCGIAAGQLYCWGANTDGQLGLGTIDDAPHPTPTRVNIPETFMVLAVEAGGRHTCAVFRDAGRSEYGTYCWGANDRRQLGTASEGPSVPSPQLVLGLASAPPAAGVAPWNLLAAGEHHTCVIEDLNRSRDGLYCFGEPGPWSGTGSGGVALVGQPAGGSYVRVALGARHGCATVLVGDAFEQYCWGEGGAGRLGTGTTDDRSMVVPVASETFFDLVAAGGADFTCTFRTPVNRSSVVFYGDVACVGSGMRGATGPLGFGRDALAPVTALNPSLEFAFDGNSDTIDAGDHHVCALSSAGLVCWGDNRYGQLGTGAGAEIEPTPALVCFD